MQRFMNKCCNNISTIIYFHFVRSSIIIARNTAVKFLEFNSAIMMTNEIMKPSKKVPDLLIGVSYLIHRRIFNQPFELIYHE